MAQNILMLMTPVIWQRARHEPASRLGPRPAIAPQRTCVQAGSQAQTDGQLRCLVRRTVRTDGAYGRCGRHVHPRAPTCVNMRLQAKKAPGVCVPQVFHIKLSDIECT